MKWATAMLVFAMLPGLAHAQKVYKCTSAAGVVTFTAERCSADATEVALTKAARIDVPEPATRSTVVADISVASDAIALDALSQQCSKRINGIKQAANALLTQLDADRVRLAQGALVAANAGDASARVAGSDIDLSAIPAHIAAIQAARDADVATAQDDCRTRREAELARQNDIAHQRRIDAAMLAQYGPAGPDAPGESPAAQKSTATPVKCELAIVSPVSGNVECVQPYGAPVDPPPARPAPSKETCDRYRAMGVDTGQECDPSQDAAHPP